MVDMDNKQTAKHLRNWVKRTDKGLFCWPTDACGYEQHIKFVNYRNKFWTMAEAKRKTFNQFVLEYADMLDAFEGADHARPHDQ